MKTSITIWQPFPLNGDSTCYEPHGRGGRRFERLTEVTKSALSKAIGKAMPTFSELEETLLDVECSVNNRPLTYQGEEFEDRAITLNILLSGGPVEFLAKNTNALTEESNMTRRLRYLKKCREQWRRTSIKEYSHALDEKQKQDLKRAEYKLKVGRTGQGFAQTRNTMENRAYRRQRDRKRWSGMRIQGAKPLCLLIRTGRI